MNDNDAIITSWESPVKCIQQRHKTNAHESCSGLFTGDLAQISTMEIVRKQHAKSFKAYNQDKRMGQIIDFLKPSQVDKLNKPDKLWTNFWCYNIADLEATLYVNENKFRQIYFIFL